MINKQNLWFITLFSLILILGIYYVTMGDETLSVISQRNDEPVINIEESDSLAALKVAEDENILMQIEEYQNVLLDLSATLEEKNDAYESLQTLSSKKGKIAEIEKVITQKFSLKSFIKMEKDQINITVSKKDHTIELANKIIREVQNLYQDQKYITVKFQ